MATLAAPGVSATARSRVDATDHDLVEAVRAGDDHAFERLYGRYHRRIATYVLGMVRDHGRAEDLTQEIFVSALRRMRQTDRVIHFKPWIYEIAKNACIDAFRRSRRTEEVSFDAEQEAGGADAARLASTTAAPEVAVDQKQRLDHLWGAFDGLSEAHHQILVMRELEGLSYAEIGKRLGMSRASVESTLFRARRRLSEEYEELQTGEACRRVQGIIGSAAGSSALGRRDQRRLGRHIARCVPCRREAVRAGLDAAAVARMPVRAKLGALLPLPAFVRRRWLGAPDAGSSAGHHVAQWSAAAASYGDAPAGWLKAAAAAVAVGLAGVGAGTAVTGHSGHARPAAGDAAVAPVARSSAAAATVDASTRRGAAGAAGRHAHPARGHSGGRDAGAPGGRRSATSTGPGAAGGTSSSGSGATRTGTGSSPPLVAADTSALTQPVSPKAPTSLGGAVQQTTEQAGTAVGGSAGQAVQDTGAATGSTIDQVAVTASDAVNGTVDAVGSTVQGAVTDVSGTVSQTAQAAGSTVGSATTAVGGALGGALGTS